MAVGIPGGNDLGTPTDAIVRPPENVSDLVRIPGGEETLFGRRVELGMIDGRVRDSETINDTQVGNLTVEISTTGICSIKVQPGSQEDSFLAIDGEGKPIWKKVGEEETVAYYGNPDGIKHTIGGNVVYERPVVVSGLIKSGDKVYLLKTDVRGRTDSWDVKIEGFDVTAQAATSDQIPK